MIARFLKLEWLYPESLSRQEQLNRFYLFSIVVLIASIAIVATWLYAFDSTMTARKQVTDEKGILYDKDAVEWRKSFEEWKARNPGKKEERNP